MPFNYSANFLSPVHLKIDHVKGSDERSLRDRCWISCSFDKLIATAPSHPLPYGSLWTRIVFLIWSVNWVSEWVGLECDWTRLINSTFYRRQHETCVSHECVSSYDFSSKGCFFQGVACLKASDFHDLDEVLCYGGVSVDDVALQCFSTSSYQSLPFRFSVLFLFWICFEREQMLLTRNPYRYFLPLQRHLCMDFSRFFTSPHSKNEKWTGLCGKKRLIESVNKWTWVLIFTMWIVNVHSIRFRKWWYIFSFWMTLINSLFWICKTMNHKYESIKFTYQTLEYRNMCSITFVIIFRLKYFIAIMFKSFSW